MPAQNICNSDKLKQFYIEYLSYMQQADAKLDSLLSANCTAEFVAAWNEDVRQIGLYDPFTNGVCDNLDEVRNTLSVVKYADHYAVSFNYTSWPNKKQETETVLVYVNADGKISHTKRPYDGYMTPRRTQT